jgi:UDP:flavonoid glycosyltransferase YjiC (YdhE family)
VVLAPEGTRGDVQPLVALGEALAARGCDVLLCAPPETRDMAAEHGLELRPTGVDARAYLGAHGAELQAGGLRTHRAALGYFHLALERQFRLLGDAVRGADLVLGAGVQLGAASLAEAHGVPYRFVAYCPAIFPSGEHPPFVLERQIRSPFVNRIAWRAFLSFYTFAVRRDLDAYRAELGLAPVRDVYAYMRSERPLLAAHPDLAPLPRDCPFEVEHVGPFRPRVRRELPAKLEAFLESGPPPVYLGFGSMPAADPVATTHDLLDAVESLGVRAIVSEGWAGLGGCPLPGDVIGVGSVPHDLLFPRVAAVVHHGGAGTTATAALAGVPQIVVPHVADQFYWARRVAELGIGPLPLPRRRLDAGRLAELIGAVVENEIVAERARELGERLRARPDGAELVAERLTAGR